MKRRIILHLTAFAVLLPCLLMFNISEKIWINLLGFVYVCYLFISWKKSETVRKFVRRYYHEILRIENMM